MSLEDGIELVVVVAVHHYLLGTEVARDSSGKVRLVLNPRLRVDGEEPSVFLRVGRQCGSLRESEVVWGLWSCTVEHLLLAEDSVVRLHDLIVGDMDATLNDLVTLYLGHVMLNDVWTPAVALCS